MGSAEKNDDAKSFDAQEQRNANPDRLLTFTDGVFAIIITILVLDLKVPDLDSGMSLRDSLAEIQPGYESFKSAIDTGRISATEG